MFCRRTASPERAGNRARRPGLLVPPPRRDRLERAGPVAGQRRCAAEPDRLRPGPRGGGPAAPSRHRLAGRLAAVARPGDGGNRRRGAGPAGRVRRRAARGGVRRAGRPADGRVVRRLGGRAAHARGRRRASPPCAPARSRRSTGRWRGRRRCWWWRMAAVFRALRAEMGLASNLRTPNGVPIFCAPGTALDAHPGWWRRRGDDEAAVDRPEGDQRQPQARGTTAPATARPGRPCRSGTPCR